MTKSSVLQIERRVSSTGLWFGLSGDLDLCSIGCAATVLEAETDGRRCDVELDLSGLDFVGLAGVEMLVEFARRIRSEARMVHVTTNRIVDRVLQLSADEGRLALATTSQAGSGEHSAGGREHRRRPSSGAFSIAGPTFGAAPAAGPPEQWVRDPSTAFVADPVCRRLE